MTHEHDPLENELASLRPMEPSVELAERIGRRLAAETTTSALTKADGTRSVPTTYWLVRLGAVAAVMLIGVIWWNIRRDPPQVETPLELAQPTLPSALDDSLPSVWTFRRATESADALESLLDKHAARPLAAGDPIQTRGFAPVTMDLNSRLGGL